MNPNPIILLITLMFADGRTERQRLEFDAPHARDLCRAKEMAMIEELRQQTQRSGLKGYTIVSCHLATDEEKTP